MTLSPQLRTLKSPAFRRRMKQIGANNTARTADADFVPSLRLLVCRERYCFGDIAMMFGVTTERVRQWCARYDIEHPDGQHLRGLNMVRVWDDAANRFEPMRYDTVRRDKSARRHAGKEASLARRRSEMLKTIIELKARLGYDPTHGEMLRAIRGPRAAVKGAAAKLASMYDTKKRVTREKYRTFVRALAGVGVYVRSRGRPGTSGNAPQGNAEIVWRQVFDHADTAPAGSRRPMPGGST